MKKIRLIIDSKCNHCKYLVEQLRKTGLIQYIDEIIEFKNYDRIDLVLAVPSVEISDDKSRTIDVLSGDLRGLLKITQYIYMYKIKNK